MRLFEKRKRYRRNFQRHTGFQATQLEHPMRDYDNVMANQMHQVDLLERSAPPALMEICRVPDQSNICTSKCLARHNVDLDAIPVPDMHEGLCRVFCQPSLWSPAFASSGDFTIKMTLVFYDHGEICFRIAVMCCCAKSIRDGLCVKPAAKRQYYISYVERTQLEIVQLMEALSLQYVGHFLADKMPRHSGRLIRKQRALDEYGEQVIQFLSFVMQITASGLNKLVVLKEPVSSNVRVRSFLGLALGYGEHALIATSSCDARIEGQDGDARPVLPSSWLDADSTISSDVSFSGKRNATKRTLLNFSHDNGNVRNGFGPLMRSCSYNWSSSAKCVRYIDPCYWFGETRDNGSFTVEISSVSKMDGVAKYAISVLSIVDGSLEVTTVDRRYSEFDKLSLTLKEKLPLLEIRKWLPPKTFFGTSRLVTSSVEQHFYSSS